MKNESGHYLASALTGRGFLSYWPELFKKLERLYLFQGNTPMGQSLAIRLLGVALADRGLLVNYFHRAEDHMVLEGLIVSSRAFGVLSFDHPCANQEFFPSHLEVVVAGLPGRNLPGYNRVLNYDKTEQLLQSARIIHNSYCSGYSAQLDTGFMEKAAGWVEEFQERESGLNHYFAGGINALGEMNFLDHLLTGCRKCYLIRGFPGTGAMVMQEILVQALSRCYSVDVFHSWIEPADRVALLFPKIRVAVVDMTCCYQDFSSLPVDIIWDLTGDTRPANFQKAGRKLQEIKSYLAEAVRLLDVSRQDGIESIDLPDEEINKIISWILKEEIETK